MPSDTYPPTKKEPNLPDRMESPEHHPSKEVPPVAQRYCRIRSAINIAVFQVYTGGGPPKVWGGFRWALKRSLVRILNKLSMNAELPISAGLRAEVSVHLDYAYDSKPTTELLQSLGLIGVISKKGNPVPLGVTKR